MKVVEDLSSILQSVDLLSFSERDVQWQTLVSKIQAMTLMDDAFFNCFMEDNIASMEYILNIIMDRDDLRVVRIQTQHSVPNMYGRSVRFDVFLIDQYGREYNFEVQNASSGAAPKRARYNSDLLDLRKLNSGDDFDALPETYVIFITTTDVLGYGLPIYHIDRHINELGVHFNDMAHIIYVNGENTSSTPLGKLMQDFQKSDPSKMHSQLLANRMKYLKSVDEEVSKMCNIVEEYVAQRVAEVEAKAAAKEKNNKLDAIRNLMKKTCWSAEEAMDAIGIQKADYPQYLALL